MSKWIILECDWEDNEIACVNLIHNEDCELAVFDNREEADDWLENHHSVGYTYNVVEIW